MQEMGNVSIDTNNIFPIIKKWLYSEKDIFIRELVSNASDAIQKYVKLVAIGDAKGFGKNKQRITVSYHVENKTITIEDNGIGMSVDEIKKYINQIAFSGAKDFIEKYEGKADDAQIIGHFGLGFYSSFMVSERVVIDSKSFQKDEQAVRWESADGMNFAISNSTRKKRGTSITLYLSEDSIEFLNPSYIETVLKKYFSFLPIEIYLSEDGADGEGKQINDTTPLWLKNPKDCTDKEYIEFYKKTFSDYNEPLFWIHLNLEYPFRLQGILYFPKMKHEFETMEGKIKLFYNQVFVAENTKEIIPEFLLLLKGCLDCPDLPLNVSRSFLQADSTIRTLSTHITKKVSDKLNALNSNEFERYQSYWDDISPFVKYGCLKDEKFYDAIKDAVLFRKIDASYESWKDLQTHRKDEKLKLYYVQDQKAQSQYITAFRDNNLNAYILDTMIDPHFITFLEMKNPDITFQGIDSDLAQALKEPDKVPDADKVQSLTELFQSVIRTDLDVIVESLVSSEIPAMLQASEESKRLAEMSKSFGRAFPMDMMNSETLIINSNNSLVQYLLTLSDNEDKMARAGILAEQIYDLAVLQTRLLEPEAMKKFIQQYQELLQGS